MGGYDEGELKGGDQGTKGKGKSYKLRADG